MQLRELGRSGLRVAPLALGGNVLGWTVEEEVGHRILDRFVDLGFNLIDTADVYSNWVAGHVGGESESMIGRWLRRSGRREEVLLATKVGMRTVSGSEGLSRDHILRSAEGSLTRLGVDRIDLYQAHVDDPRAPFAETLSAFGELERAGKVRAIGASNYAAPRLDEAIRSAEPPLRPPFECLQPRYNLVERSEFEGPLEDVCRSHSLGVIPYAALASGFLTGKYRSTVDLAKSLRGPGAGRRLSPRGLRILEALDGVSDRHGTTPVPVALAWLLSHPVVTAPIASVSTVEQLDEFVRAIELRLDRSDLASLDEASASGPDDRGKP